MVLAPTLTLSAGSGAAIARPTFSRDFAGEKTLNNGTGPSITFTRASDATYFDADGVLRFAPNNAIRNSQAGGAVVGAPGTVPTNWFIGAQSGISTEVMATGTENGLAYVDVKFTGTNSTGGNVFPNLFFDTSTTVVASSGETWTGSFYTKIVAGSTAGLTNTSVQFVELTAAGAVVSALNTPFTPTSSLARYSATRTLTGATTERVYARFICTLPDGAQIGGSAAGLTLRFAAPQLERGSSATAYNPTTGTAFFGPRFDHDPATAGNPSRGLLIEESRQNLLQRSEEFDNAYWTKANATVTANAVTAPDGTTTADAVFETAASGFHAIQRGLAIPSTAIYTASFFVKANGRTQFALQIGIIYAEFNLSAGTAAVIGGGASDAASILALPNGWYRCTFTRSATADETVFMVFNNGSVYDYTGNAALGFYIWGAQLEAGAFPTSYIPTTSAAVTRQADSAIVNPISSFYNAAEGTLFAEASSFSSAANASSVALTAGGSADERIQLRVRGSAVSIVAAAATSFVSSSADPAANVANKRAAAAKLNDFAVSTNGGAAETDTAGDMPSVTHLVAGALSTGLTQPLNGHIRRIAYFPKRLSNALLQSLTT
jgi:hypothetical protein